MPPVSLIPAAISPPVLLIPVVHLDLRLSPRIFEKNRNGPNAILWGWGETDSSKKPEAKNLVTLSLKRRETGRLEKNSHAETQVKRDMQPGVNSQWPQGLETEEKRDR